METLLLVVTGVLLVVALFLGWTAWRLSRAERERAMARVAALAAAAAEPQSASQPAAHDMSTRTELSAFADARASWPGPSRPRSSTRVAAARPAAAQEISWASPKTDELPLRHEPVPAPVMGDAFLGTTTADRSNGGQRLIAVAAFLLLMVLGAAGAWMYSTSGPASSAARGASTAAPLELISLRHVREGDRLSVMGLVRNPASGALVDRLSAAVLLFDQLGGYLTSTRAPIDVPYLAPGNESPFTLSVQAPAGATRYRVSFRTDERIVDHVDRRGQAPAVPASTLPATAATR